MNTQTIPVVERGTPGDLLRATACGARIAARKFRASGLDEASVRQRVVGRFCAEFGDDEPGELIIETLVAVVRRSVDEVLGYPMPEPMVV